MERKGAEYPPEAPVMRANRPDILLSAMLLGSQISLQTLTAKLGDCLGVVQESKPSRERVFEVGTRMSNKTSCLDGGRDQKHMPSPCDRIQIRIIAALSPPLIVMVG